MGRCHAHCREGKTEAQTGDVKSISQGGAKQDSVSSSLSLEFVITTL
jgi:hypothetical protein